MPKISIIIPNYNHAPYLKERIDSVLNQTYTDFELIILDDKSNDNSRGIIESYRGHEKISKIIYNEKNSGSTFKQWQKGIDVAQGDWIWIAESDDVASPIFLKLLIDSVETNNCELGFCNSQLIDENGEDTILYNFENMPSKKHYKEFQQFNVWNSIEFRRTWMVTDNFIPNASGVIFKKELVQQAWWIRLTKMKLMGDWLFWILFLEEAKNIVYLPDSLNLFRCHKSNVRSLKAKYRILEMIDVINTVEDQKMKDKLYDAFAFRYIHKSSDLMLTLPEKIMIHKFFLMSKKYLFLIKSLIK